MGSQVPRNELGAPDPRVRKKADPEDIDKALDEVESYRMPLMEHLVELRDRLIKAALALALGMGIGFFYADRILDFLIVPFDQALSATGVRGSLSMVHSPFEGFSTWMRVAFMAGVLLASPVISWQIWAFIAPGLYKEERSAVVPLAMSSAVLFIGGAAFCYYVMLPFAFPFFLQVLPVEVNLSVDGYLTSVIWMMVAFGACFQLPVIAWFLARLGFVDHRDMLDGGRYAIVAIFIIAAILTPPDPISQIMLAVPMCLLYGVGIGVAWLTTTKVRT